MKKICAVLIVFGLLTGLNVISAWAQADQAKKAAEGKKVLEEWIAAQGGREVISKIKDNKISCALNLVAQGLNGTLTIQQKNPGKIRQDIDIMGMKIIQAYNGTKGWMTNPGTGAVEDMPEVLATGLKRGAMDNDLMLNPEKNGVVFILEGRQSIEGKEYLILKETYSDGFVATHYLDSETHMLFKTVAMSLGQMGEKVERETFMSDYRDVEGTKVPFSININQGGAKYATCSVKEYKFNINPDDAFFDKP